VDEHGSCKLIKKKRRQGEGRAIGPDRRALDSGAPTMLPESIRGQEIYPRELLSMRDE
jgi:hypothetical protein